MRLGYHIKEIFVDPAKVLSGLVPREITVVGSRMHVADAEVEIRTVKERLRSSTHGLPYDLPHRVVRWQEDVLAGIAHTVEINSGRN